jgi:hypothetical protein
MAKQNSRFLEVARLALEMGKKVLPLYSHLNSPHRFTLPQLNACVMLMFYLRLSYRDMEEWLLVSDKICRQLGLEAIPDHTTLYRAYKRLRLTTFERLKRALLDSLALQEEIIVLDTTGYRPVQASPYYMARCGRSYRTFAKGGYAVGAESQLILGWKQDFGPAADTAFLEPLRRQAMRYGCKSHGKQAWLLLADCGFDSHTARPDDLIPPQHRGRGGPIRSTTRIARFELVSAARLDGIFGQRWKCETVNSVIKRKFGDEIRSRKLSHRKREPIVKGLIYNLHVL